jgi:biotin carboxyl carrier protein
MKKLKITVNNRAYEVLVEVLEDDEQTVAGSGYLSPLPPMAAPPRTVAPPEATPVAAPVPDSTPPAPAATPPAPPAPAPTTPVPAAPAPVPSAPSLRVRSPHTILAPMAGTVQEVFVTTGATVEAGSPMVMLDVMTLDTCIYAPAGGLVTEVAVAPGDIVQAGDDLIRYMTED